MEFLRYYRWQENEADVKLNICPNLKVDKLKELMKDSGSITSNTLSTRAVGLY